MFRSLYDKVQRQINLKEEDRIALLEQWKKSGAKPEITGWWNGQVLYVGQEDDLQEAIDAIPVGGIGEIHLATDYTLSKDIYVRNKHVRLFCHRNTLYTQRIVRSGGYKSVFGIYVLGSLEVIEPIVKVTPSIPDGWNDAYNHDAQSFLRLVSGNVTLQQYSHGYSDGQVIIDLQENNLIALNYEYFSWNHSATSHGFSSFYYSGSSNSTKAILNKLIWISGSNTPTASIGIWLYNTTLQDKDGNALSISDAIAGVIKDSNGNPRNVISNIVL